MELTSGKLSRDEYQRAIADSVEFLREAGLTDVLVVYGFGCDCPDEQLYQDVSMPRGGPDIALDVWVTKEQEVYNQASCCYATQTCKATSGIPRQ